MAKLLPEQLSLLWALQSLRSLHAAGVRHFVFSPGFRNAPLIVALHELAARDPSYRAYSHVDERGAAFFALGLSKQGGAPAAVLCTSGTAAANFHPAVLEAYYSYTPLVLVTADRPPELIGIGANQAMNQQNLFGNHVRFYAGLSVPADEETKGPWDYTNYSLSKAVMLSQSGAKGPVHVNLAFREPFLPEALPKELLEAFLATSIATAHFTPVSEEPTISVVAEVKHAWVEAKRVLVLVGTDSAWSDEERDFWKKLAAKGNTFVLAEAASGLTGVSTQVEAILRNCEVPDILVRVGAPLTTRVALQFQEKVQKAGNELWVFDGIEAARNPSLGRARYFGGSLSTWLRELSCLTVAHSSEWKHSLEAQSLLVEEKKQALLASEKALSELHVSGALSRILPKEASLFLGNSMPLRDFDLAAKLTQSVRLFSNRGLSGIDGLISTILGVAVSRGTPTYALLGDLSTLHDISALSLAKRLENQISLQLFVLNNQGGDIFRVVKTKSWPQYETQFTTPQELDFAALAKGFGLRYESIESQEQLKAWLATPVRSGITVVECKIDRSANARLRKLLAEL